MGLTSPLSLYSTEILFQCFFSTAIIFSAFPERLHLILYFAPLLLSFLKNKKCLTVHGMNGKVFLRELYFAGKQYLSTLSKNDILFVKQNVIACFLMRCLHVLKKRETCAFLSHLIYSFTVYIVNNKASLYVECSIKHFYFNHLVKQLEKKCVSHSPCSVCWLAEEGLAQWNECIIYCERLMAHTTWMLERVHLLSTHWGHFLFCFFYFLHYCFLKQIKKKKSKALFKKFCNKLY